MAENLRRGLYTNFSDTTVERKKKNRKLPVKLFWIEYCERAEAEKKLAYSYQMFARLFADEAERMDATR
jgi:hypothetical protein